ncbi:MAG: radical SAM protein [Bacteroidota bacterium]|jgi:DNA repair photolyase
MKQELLPQELGLSSIEYKKASSILTEGKGFLAGYDYSLNPYSGCTFGCVYCYAAFFSRSKPKMDNWGKWLEVKENALALLIKKRKKLLTGKSIYLSSVTDPYQPIERKLELTRSLLQELLFHQPKLVIQTRSPLIVRDIDLLLQFEDVQVNMTVTTDDERVRKVFEPYCPSNQKRLEAIAQLQKAGIPSCITITPMLPVKDANQFATQLKATGVKRFIIQPFHSEKGKFVAGTKKEATDLLQELNWDDKKYFSTLEVLHNVLPQTGVGKDGFNPEYFS